MEHLAGERGLRETVEWVKARTRQYAKRQLTWFRQQLDLEWVSVEAGTSAEEVAMGLRGRLR
jgi:tRNA dimethylallyltransferase